MHKPKTTKSTMKLLLLLLRLSSFSKRNPALKPCRNSKTPKAPFLMKPASSSSSNLPQVELTATAAATATSVRRRRRRRRRRFREEQTNWGPEAARAQLGKGRLCRNRGWVWGSK
jgi:hypothetical protein